MKQSIGSVWRYGKWAYMAVVVIWLCYVALIFFSPTTNQYHLNLTTTTLIRISFALPILFIWLTAALAAVRFKNYAKLIAGSHEAAAFNALATGLLCLAGYMVLVLIMSRIAPLFDGTPLLYPAIFLKNHLAAYLFIMGAIQLYRGSGRLADIAKINISRQQLLTTISAYVVFAALFVALFYSNLTNPRTLSANIPSFAVSHTTLLFTLVIPSLIGWLLALLAGLTIKTYAVKVKGLIYKQSLRRLVVGLWATTGFAILVQLLTLYASQLTTIGLNAVLIIVYLFLAAYGVGAILIARSASKLTLIEVAK